MDQHTPDSAILGFPIRLRFVPRRSLANRGAFGSSWERLSMFDLANLMMQFNLSELC
jgi:hypothetical protein